MKSWLRRVPVVRDILAIRDASLDRARPPRAGPAVAVEAAVREVLGTSKYRDSRRLAMYEAQVFSQSGEDGILAEIFGRVGTTERRFV